LPGKTRARHLFWAWARRLAAGGRNHIALCRRAGRPQQGLVPVVVGGTNKVTAVGRERATGAGARRDQGRDDVRPCRRT